MKRYLLPALTALLCATCVTWAQNSSLASHNDGTLGGVRYLEPGQRPVIIHPTVEAAKQARKSGGSSSNNLYYHGGTSDGLLGVIGVETAPRIYLVFWGSQWTNNDPSGEAS